MEGTLKKLNETIELLGIHNASFSDYLESLKLGLIKPVAAAVDTVGEFVGIYPDSTEKFDRINADIDQHMPLLSDNLVCDAENTQHTQRDNPDLTNNAVGINADDDQHKPLLRMDITHSEVDVDHYQHGPNIRVDDPDDYLMIKADFDQHDHVINSSYLSNESVKNLINSHESDIAPKVKISYCTFCFKSSHIKKYCWKLKGDIKKKKRFSK